MIKFLVKLWSYSMILPWTDDNNFGTNELKEKASYRISLFGIFWGHAAIYLITYNFSKKRFSIYHKIILEECGKSLESSEETDLKNKAKKYEEHIKEAELSDDDIDVEKEYISYSNGRQRERSELGERKLNLYATVTLAILPILLVLFDINTFLSYSMFEKILAVYMMYFILNVILLIFDSMKVKGYIYGRFSEVKETSQKRIKASRNYYLDWQSNQNAATTMISYVLNVENLIKYTIILAVVLTAINSIKEVNLLESLYPERVQHSNVITIAERNLDDPYSRDSAFLTEVELNIRNKECDKVIFLVSNNNSKKNILKYFDEFHETEIVFYIDNKQDKNYIKIIME